MAKSGQVIIENPGWCKGCGICVELCPTDVLALKKGIVVIVKEDSCIGCENCELSCPDYVLKVVKKDG